MRKKREFKKEYAVLIILVVMVILMSIIPYENYDFQMLDKLIQDVASNKTALGVNLPLSGYVNTNSENVFAQIYEEDENSEREVEIDIDDGYSSPQPAVNGGKILLYHTHQTETYTMEGDFSYTPSGEFRTEDTNNNLAFVGEEFEKELEALGMEVTHDKTNFEPPTLNTAYSRSLDMLNTRVDDGEQYDIYIDLHRDHYEKEDDIVVIDGKNVARIMLVVGTGQGNNGNPILPLPNYQANYAYAQQITNNLNAIQEGFGRDIMVSNNRYNQHISDNSILIELGYTGNNMEEVLNALPYLAQAIRETVQTE